MDDYCVYCKQNKDPVAAAKKYSVEDGIHICKRHRNQLNRAWKRGEIDRGKGGGMPRLFFVWAWKGFDFKMYRRLALASLGLLKGRLTDEEQELWNDWIERRESCWDIYRPKPNVE